MLIFLALVFSFPALACVELIAQKSDVPWLPSPHEVRVFRAGSPVDMELVTGVYVLIFDGDNLLLGHRKQKQEWDIVGGHVDLTDKNLEEAIRRETLEEVAVELKDLRLVAFEEIHLKGEKPEGYKYPFPKSYQAFFVARVHRINDMKEDEDTDQRAWFTPTALAAVDWARKNALLIEYARRFL